MKTITVFCDRLYAAQVKPQKFLNQIQDWENSGYRVNFQIQDNDGATFMHSLVARQQNKAPSNTFQFVGLFLLGIASGLISIFVGWTGLLR